MTRYSIYYRDCKGNQTRAISKTFRTCREAIDHLNEEIDTYSLLAEAEADSTDNLFRQEYNFYCTCYVATVENSHLYTRNNRTNLLYRKYRNMIDRCYQPSTNGYEYYGGRGIRVSPVWVASYEAFVDWAIAHGYRADLDLDRIYTDYDYTPENCRFIEHRANVNNRRNTRFVYTNSSERIPLSVYCEKHGLKYKTVLQRVNKLQWTIREAVGIDNREEK